MVRADVPEYPDISIYSIRSSVLVVAMFIHRQAVIHSNFFPLLPIMCRDVSLILPDRQVHPDDEGWYQPVRIMDPGQANL